MLKLQEWVFPDGDGDAERQESLHYLLAQWPTGRFCQKALKLAATHMHTYTRTWPLWFSTQTKTATAKMQMLSGEKWGEGGLYLNKAHIGKPFKQEIHEVAGLHFRKHPTHFSCQAGTDNTYI